MKKILYSILIGAAAVFALSACSEKEPETASADVKGISFNAPSVQLFVGEVKETAITVTPSGANTAQLSFVSSDPSVVTTTGRYITGVKAGTAKVTVTASKDGGETVTASTVLNVVVKNHSVTGVTPSVPSVELFKNKTTEISATVAPDNATIKDLTFSTSDANVVAFEKVSGEDKVVVASITGTKATVKGIAPGTATITIASVEDPSKTATVAVTVENVDDIDMWASDEAGSIAIVGGDQADIAASGDNFLSYSKSTGKVSWTANNTGKVRSAELSLSSGSKIKVTQIGPKEFVGSWNFLTKIFAPNTALGYSGNTDPLNQTLTITEKAGTTASDGSKNVTNNLAVAGLINTYIAEAVVDIDYSAKTYRFGLFFNGNKAQAVNTGKTGYDYIVMLPEYGTGWGSYNFAPVPFNNGTNYGWLWFVVDDIDSMHYGIQDWYKMDGKDVLGISFCAVSKAEPTSSDYAQAINTNKYDVIHQCNPKGSGADSNNLKFVLTRNE